MGSSSEPESRQAPGSDVLLREHFVILGPFGVWGEQLWAGSRSPEFQPLFCPKPQCDPWKVLPPFLACVGPPRKECWRTSFPIPNSCPLAFPGSLAQAKKHKVCVWDNGYGQGIDRPQGARLEVPCHQWVNGRKPSSSPTMLYGSPHPCQYPHPPLLPSSVPSSPSEKATGLPGESPIPPSLAPCLVLNPPSPLCPLDRPVSQLTFCPWILGQAREKRKLGGRPAQRPAFPVTVRYLKPK